MLQIYNTLSRKKEDFKPLKKGQVGMYTCGPTVYSYDHLGHAWNYFNSDILRRVFEYSGYNVGHVMNITDVGHLTSDGDTGEDKLEKAAKAGGKSAHEIAEYFTEIYLANRKKLNFLEPNVICKATDHIQEMIELVQVLIDKGYGYQTSDGIYFDTSKFSQYGQLSGNTLDKLKEGARVEINPEKKNPTDFALWKFSAEGEKRQMEWDAFGHKGFPGWHIECSAMSMKYLGKTFDVHTGGEDNIFPHHECEIAQSECANGVKFVDYWFHTRFLMVEGEKMSKSKNNFYRLQDLEEKGFVALDLRYLFLTSHYRSQLNFTWAGLEGAKTARMKLNDFVAGIDKVGKINKEFQNKFIGLINDDLAMPQVMALVWEVIKSDIADEDKKATLLDFDRVLGLNLDKIEIEEIPQKVTDLAEQRIEAKKSKDFKKSDELRDEINKLGYIIEDTPEGYNLKKK
ncbi:MAG: cysteine--tRNA ligase [Patescibacteria group bacterium]|jgi:cysteinyl-tRNA synthetase